MDDALRRRARHVRRALRAGAMSRALFSSELTRVPFRDRDAWVDEVLSLGAPPADIANLPRGAVPYVPCGVDAILHAVRDAPVTPHDVFVDLGAGLGRVAMLVHLLTGARAVGVELQAPLVERGTRAAAELSLGGSVQLRCGDAAETIVNEGTVFFAYASFGPAVLRAVLHALARMASSQRVVLCAVGFDVHQAPWLIARASFSPELTFYEPRIDT